MGIVRRRRACGLFSRRAGDNSSDSRPLSLFFTRTSELLFRSPMGSQGSPFAFLMNRVPGRSKSFGRQEALFLPPGHTGISCLTYSSRTEVKRSPASALGMTRWLPKPPSASRASAAWRKKGTLLNKELVLGLTAQLLRWMRTASAVEDATPTFHGSCIKVLTTWMKIPRRVFSLLPVAASTFLTAGGLGQ